MATRGVETQQRSGELNPSDYQQKRGEQRFLPEGNDDELCVLGSVFDVVRDDGHVPEIQRGVDFVHEIQRGGLYVKSRSQSEKKLGGVCESAPPYRREVRTPTRENLGSSLHRTDWKYSSNSSSVA